MSTDLQEGLEVDGKSLVQTLLPVHECLCKDLDPGCIRIELEEDEVEIAIKQDPNIEKVLKNFNAAQDCDLFKKFPQGDCFKELAKLREAGKLGKAKTTITHECDDDDTVKLI